jgi:hypothetical protein
LKVIKKLYLVNAEYIRCMYAIYSGIKDACEKNKECENLIFINRFKSFILETGISVKIFGYLRIKSIMSNVLEKLYTTKII